MHKENEQRTNFVSKISNDSSIHNSLYMWYYSWHVDRAFPVNLDRQVYLEEVDLKATEDHKGQMDQEAKMVK